MSVAGPGGALTGIVAIAVGQFHSLVLTAGGTVLAWGDNTYGQIGDGTMTLRSAPVAVDLPGRAVAIAAGGAHSLALLADGTVYAWGFNGDGELGDGNGGFGAFSPVPIPVLAPDGQNPLTGIVALAAGNSHSLALTADGQAFAWGDNADGELGDGTGGDGTAAHDSAAPVPVKGVGSTGSLSRVTLLAGGGAHSLAAVNTAPAAAADAYRSRAGVPLTVPAPGVLANDTDPEGDILFAAPSIGPAHGALALNADGSFVYTPTAGYGGPDSFTYQVQDPYGVGGAATVTLLVDGSAPTTTASLSGPAGANGFYKGSVSVTLSATDPDGPSDVAGTFYTVDGGPQQTYSGSFPITGDGTHTIAFFSRDQLGNAEATQTLTLPIDSLAPVTAANAQSTTTGQQVTLSATDGFSGVANMNYSIDGGAPQAYTVPFTVTGNGPHVVRFQSADRAGNVEALKTLSFTINIAAPLTTAALSGPQGDNGYFRGAVTVTLTARSPSSTVTGTFYTLDGGARQIYTAPFTVSGDGTHTVTFFSTDAAGNTEATNTLTVKIDATAPVTTATSAGSQVTLSATDDGSGVAQTVYTLDGGPQTIYSSAFTVTGAGAHTVRYHSIDKAGNVEADRTLAVTIAPAAPGVLHTYPAGLQLFSAPEDYSNVPLAQTLGTPSPRLAVWLPGLLQYILTPAAPADALRSGQGYWARFPQDTPLLDTGTPARTDQAFGIPLQRGWNMIGDPFAGAVPLSAVRVLDGAGNSLTLAQANPAGLVFPTLYAFPAGSTAYQAVDASGGSLAPYQGYWVYALRACTLSVPPPAP